jgi:hypothetical protein
MDSSSFYSLRFGDVIFVKDSTEKSGHYWIVVSEDAYNADNSCDVVIMARGTMHSQRKGYPAFPGEVPLLYPEPSIFPARFQFQLSLFQMHEIEPFVKLELARAADANIQKPRDCIVEARLLGPCLPLTFPLLRKQLREIWCGYEGPRPTTPPRKQPLLSKIRRGAVVHTSAHSGNFLVVSHDFIHDWFPSNTLILVPIRDLSDPQFEHRYWLDGMHRLNINYAEEMYRQKYGPQRQFQIQLVKESIANDELDKVLHACRLILGIREVS